jgi:DNA polymerase-3 subunit gamma/tau
MKNGAEPRTQLELALVKAAAPDVDASTRALLARLERLEDQLGGGVAPAPARSEPAPPPKAAAVAGGVSAAAPAPAAAAQAVAVAAAPEPVGVIELWPAVMETVRGQHQLAAAALEQGRPAPVDDRVVVAFPATAAFFKRQAEKDEHRAALTQAIREVSGQKVGVAYEIRDDVEQTTAHELSPEELIERFKAEFGAEEIFEDEDQH